jgi:CRP-like cAMP-binding protein
MRAHDNYLLARLDAAAFEELEGHGSLVALSSGDVIAEAFSELDKVYFPHAGIISCTVALAGGGVIETAMIGRDGAFGAAIALHGKRVVNPAVVQVRGAATAFDARIFAEIVERHPNLRKLILAYEHFHLSEVQQTAACNAVHAVLARTCRWILRMHDLVGGEIVITQEHLSQMMGVRRTSVTAVAKELQSEGAISITRGRMRILDVGKIAALACECHADVAHNYRSLFR